MKFLHKIKTKTLHFLLIIVVLIYILFEELVWEIFAEPVVRFIKELKLLKTLSILLEKVDSRVILSIFVVIFVIAEVLGTYAAILFVKGSVSLAVIIYALKIPLAGFAFWLFNEKKERLLRFRWFKLSYEFIMKWIEVVKNSQIYQLIKYKASLAKKYTKEYLPKGKKIINKKIKVIYDHIKNRYF